VNKPTVIAFYPGAGGNRYLRYLTGKEYLTPDITYDNKFTDQKFEFRYLLEKVKVNQEFILTHCLNYSHINEQLNPKKVIMINSDFKKSLRREWWLNGNNLYKQKVQLVNQDCMLTTYNNIKDPNWPNILTVEDMLPDHKKETMEKMSKYNVPEELNSAWATVSWHHAYYEKYPVELGYAEIANDQEFVNFMEYELNKYDNEYFNFSWDIFNRYGPNATINELYLDK
jgi:hypothetical protein